MALQENSYYTVAADTKFRYESFGGVVYQRAADRLYFVNSRWAVTLLLMAGCGSVREIAEKLSARSPDVSQAQILTILQRWEELGVIRETEAAP